MKRTYYFSTYGFVFIALGLSAAALGPMLPFLAEFVDVNLSQISFLFTTSSFGYMLGSAGGGRLFDKYCGHVLMLAALLLLVIMLVFIPLTADYYFLLAILFFLGLGQGVLDVGANVSILWVYQAQVGPYMNALHFCFGAGAFLSPLIVHQALQWSGGQLTWPFWALAVFSLPAMLGLWRLASPVNPEKDHIANTSDKPHPGLVGAMMILFFLYVGIEGGFGGWIFTYITETNIASNTSAAYINSVFWGMLTLGRLMAVRLAKHIKPSKLLIGNFILAMGFLGLILLFPLKLWTVWISSAGLGLALSSIFPTLLVLGESRLRITGKTTGLFFLGVSLGGVIIPMVLGQIFEYVGSYQVILVLFFLTGIGLSVLFSLIMTSNRMGEKIRS